MGDHFQLPPLVTSRAAEEGGLGISLFKRLCEAHPQVRLQNFNNDQHTLGWHLHTILQGLSAALCFQCMFVKSCGQVRCMGVCCML